MKSHTVVFKCSIQTDRLDEANKWFLQHFAVSVPKTECDTVSALLTLSVMHQNVCFHFLLTISVVASLYRSDIARGCSVLHVALHYELNDFQCGLRNQLDVT